MASQFNFILPLCTGAVLDEDATQPLDDDYECDSPRFPTRVSPWTSPHQAPVSPCDDTNDVGDEPESPVLRVAPRRTSPQRTWIDLTMD